MSIDEEIAALHESMEKLNERLNVLTTFSAALAQSVTSLHTAIIYSLRHTKTTEATIMAVMQDNKTGAERAHRESTQVSGEVSHMVRESLDRLTLAAKDLDEGMR